MKDIKKRLDKIIKIEYNLYYDTFGGIIMAKKEMRSYNYLYPVPAVLVGSIVNGNIGEWTAEPFKIGEKYKLI
jgi:hypothetical protein